MKPPGARLARTLGCSSETRNNDMDMSTAANEMPLMRNAQPVPTLAISRPASAGPTMRAALKDVTDELRDKGLSYGRVKRCRRTEQKGKHVHVPEPGDAGDRKDAQDERKDAHRRLRQYEEFALIETVRGEACPRQQQQLGSKLQAHDNANGRGIVVG